MQDINWGIWAKEREIYGAYGEPCQRQEGSAKTLTFKGQTKTIAEWSKTTGISRRALRKRLNKAWDIERILTQPSRRQGITFRGKTQSLFDWSKEIGISIGTLEYRLYKAKWSVERTLTEPVTFAAKRDPDSSKQITFNGKSQHLTAWARELGLPYRTIRWRLVNLGWSVEDAFSFQPSRERLPQKKLYTFEGRSQNLRSWSQELSIPYRVLLHRIKELKWPIERALLEPVRSQRGKTDEPTPNSNYS